VKSEPEPLTQPPPRPDRGLEVQDTATSDDPLEIHLQRRGWNLKRVRQLQESISAKLTVDMFTNETKPLSAAEKELQRDITDFLKRGQ